MASTKTSGYHAKKEWWKLPRYSRAGKVDTSRAPKWWISRPGDITEFLRSLKGVSVRSIGTSAGGHPIMLAARGRKEPRAGRTAASLASALSGNDASAFYGQRKSDRQTFLFIGASHGNELAGTVAMTQVMNIAATGKDLRGKAWPRLAKAARRMRLLFIPYHNIDGRMRVERVKHWHDVDPKVYQYFSQGMYKNGERLVYPGSKRIWPLPAEKMEWLGTYFNDHGVNLVYDHGYSAGFQPETQALLEVLRDEMPDSTLHSHSNNGSLANIVAHFIPDHYRMRAAQISALVGQRCLEAGYEKHGYYHGLQPYMRKQSFYQTDLAYHACGALPILVEFPCGHQGNPKTLDRMMDISLAALEEILVFGALRGFRPDEPRW